MLKIYAVNTPDDDGVVWGGFKMTGILNGCAYSWEFNLHFVIYGNYVLLFRNRCFCYISFVVLLLQPNLMMQFFYARFF